MLALAAYEAGVHDGCGLHDSIAMEDPFIEIIDRTCPICAALAASMRKRAADEREVEKDYPPGKRHAEDGRRSFVRVLSPAEVEARKKGESGAGR